MASLRLTVRPCVRLSAGPAVVLGPRIRPWVVSPRLPNTASQRSTSTVRHISSSFARNASVVKDSKNDDTSERKDIRSRNTGILARILPSSLQPPENSAGGLRKLVSLMKPERKPLIVAVGLVRTPYCVYSQAYAD